MDKRFLKEEGIEVFTGNELLVKGGLEGRMALLTGYPGSPVSDVFEAASAAADYMKQHGILAQIANNEALSVARLNGTQMADIRAMAVMKSLGLHVASDGAALGNLAESPGGGALIVVGDDPWMDSTQINNDSRFICQHLHIPVIEPSTFQEIKDWISKAFEISGKSSLYVGYLITTHQADGGGTVRVHKNRFPEISTINPTRIDTSRIPLDETVLLPPKTWAREETLPARFEKFLKLAREHGLNKILHPFAHPEGKKKPIGFVASGLSYLYLEHALGLLGLSGEFPILRLGVSYPVDAATLLTFARQVKSIFVIEEKRGFVESQISDILRGAYQRGDSAYVPLWGKNFPDGNPGVPVERGLHPSILMERLAPVLEKLDDPTVSINREKIRREVEEAEKTGRYLVQIPSRTPTFCPGCPHRDSSSLFLEIKKNFKDPRYMQRKHNREPVDLLFHGETGCFTMLMFEPNKDLMHNYSGMGLGGGTGAGIDPFITNKQVVFLGDSTFFHSGMLAISDSIKNNQDITYVILDNKTTAMTGHQPTPANDVDIMGEKTFAQRIEGVVQGLVGDSGIPVIRTNPSYRESYRELLEEMVLKDGVKVVIADKECGITYHRREKARHLGILREKGFLGEERFINITPEVCEYCLECTRSTGCPGLTIEETDFGPKIQTDLSACVSDGACTRLKVCPSFEEVIVRRKKAPPARKNFSADGLPLPAMRRFDDLWSVYMAGVGGMGTGVLSAVLTRAGEIHGYKVVFSDKKGLAIRNGGVYANVLFAKENLPLSPVIPYGKADLLLGIDILEAVRGIDPHFQMRVASPARTASVVNIAKTPTILTLMGNEDFEPAMLEEALMRYTRNDLYFSADFSDVSQRFLGSKQYTNIILLGAAFQRGLLPLSIGDVEWGIRHTVSPGVYDENFQALTLGRILAHDPSSLGLTKKIQTLKEVIAEKEALLSRGLGGKKRVEGYRRLLQSLLSALAPTESLSRAIANRVYDLIRYENLSYAENYVEKVLQTFRRDLASGGYEATKTVIFNLHKVMAIKDEVYVSLLLTSSEKLERDRKHYGIDEENGDSLSYAHLNRPQFSLFGRDFAFDFNTKNWMLNLMKRMKFLRRLLPDWHKREKAFRDGYISWVDGFTPDGDARSYSLYVEMLRLPESCRGFREIVYPKMDAAQKRAEELLAQIAQPHAQPMKQAKV